MVQAAYLKNSITRHSRDVASIPLRGCKEKDFIAHAGPAD